VVISKLCDICVSERSVNYNWVILKNKNVRKNIALGLGKYSASWQPELDLGTIQYKMAMIHLTVKKDLSSC
jgi:hypothetical protein